WLQIERMHLKEGIIGAAGKALAVAIRLGCGPDIQKMADILIRIDSANESAHTALIEWALSQGQLSEALRRFEVCRQAFRREFDSEPPATVQRLAEVARSKHNNSSNHEVSARPKSFRRLPSVALIARPSVGPPELTIGLAGFLFDELVRALG